MESRAGMFEPVYDDTEEVVADETTPEDIPAAAALRRSASSISFTFGAEGSGWMEEALCCCWIPE